MKQAVLETYNGQLASMRKEGQTLQQIGNYAGVTRERIRQLLNEHYGGTKMPLLPEWQAAKVIGCNPQRLVKLRKEGIVHPRHTSYFNLYDRDQLEKAMLALQKSCTHCGGPLPFGRQRKYCDRCGQEYRRYSYPFFNEEARRRHREKCRSWNRQHRHPLVGVDR